MRSFEQKEKCPHCGHDLHRQPYLMARRAEKNVWSLTQIAWRLAAVMAFIVLMFVVQ